MRASCRRMLSLLLVLIIFFYNPNSTLAVDYPLSTWIWGVTIDSTTNLSEIINSLSSLPSRPTSRIVFDEWVSPSQYTTAVNQIGQVSNIMGEILDSFYVKSYSLEQYKQRTTDYLNAFSGKVNIWEIANEINGEWLGDTPSVVAKMTAAYDLVKARGQKAAITLYYNGTYDNGQPTSTNCWENPKNHMMTWATANIPQYMKEGLDYVFVSYYEEDCLNLKPDWTLVFQELSQKFPNSKIGFGEVGRTGTTFQKEEYLRRYYSLKVNAPRFIGGYFWWYFKQDMVPKTKYLWTVLSDILTSQIITTQNSGTPILSPPIIAGDCNGDRVVDLIDFGIWKREYLSGGGLTSDFDHDTKVDLVDFNIWKVAYLHS